VSSRSAVTSGGSPWAGSRGRGRAARRPAAEGGRTTGGRRAAGRGATAGASGPRALGCPPWHLTPVPRRPRDPT